MANKNRSRSSGQQHSPLMLIMLAIVLLAVGALAYSFFQSKVTTPPKNSTRSVNSVDYSKPSAADNDQGNARKESNTPSSTLNDNPTASSTSNMSSFTVDIVSDATNGDNLHVGTMVSGITDGNCSLSASKSGQTTLQLATSLVQQDVNAYDCGVYNIATSTFPVSGDWTLILMVTSNGTVASNTATAYISN